MNKSYFTAIADYNAWVSSIAISWLKQISEEQWQQEINSSFSSVRLTTLHMVSAEKVWLDFWKGIPQPTFLSATFTGTKQDLISIWKQASEEVKQYMASCSEQDYQRSVRFGWAGQSWELEFWQTVAHFNNHATYHRGQLVTLLRQVGFSSFSNTDMATYFRTHQH